jgi:hypothetical protein
MLALTNHLTKAILDLANRHPDRVGAIFAFAANAVTSGVKDGVEKNPTFAGANFGQRK